MAYVSTPADLLDAKIGELTTLLDTLKMLNEAPEDGELRRVTRNTSGLLWLAEDMVADMQHQVVILLSRRREAANG